MKLSLLLLSLFPFLPVGVERAAEYLAVGAEDASVVVVEVAVVVGVVAVVEEEAVVEEVEVADTADRGSVWMAIVHILGRLCTLDAKETVADGAACAAFTRLLASM